MTALDDESEALASLIWTTSFQFSNPRGVQATRWEDVSISAARQSARYIAEAVQAAGFRRQGPITDAQVEIAMRHLWRGGADGITVVAMRAALEAAREVQP